LGTNNLLKSELGRKFTDEPCARRTTFPRRFRVPIFIRSTRFRRFNLSSVQFIYKHRNVRDKVFSNGPPPPYIPTPRWHNTGTRRYFSQIISRLSEAHQSHFLSAAFSVFDLLPLPATLKRSPLFARAQYTRTVVAMIKNTRCPLGPAVPKFAPA